MKLALWLAPAVLLLAACSTPAGQESSAAAGGSAPKSCAADSYGATACRAGMVFRCEKGGWNSTFRPC